MVKKSFNRIWKLENYKYHHSIPAIFRQFKSDIRDSIQRINRGFCWRDCYSFNYFHASLLAEIFHELATKGMSYGALDEEDVKFIGGKVDANEYSYENWLLFLTTMSDLFASYCVDATDTEEYRELDNAEEKHLHNLISKEELDSYFDKWCKKADELERIGNDNLQKAMQLLTKNYFSIWD